MIHCQTLLCPPVAHVDLQPAERLDGLLLELLVLQAGERLAQPVLAVRQHVLDRHLLAEQALLGQVQVVLRVTLDVALAGQGAVDAAREGEVTLR